MNFKISKKEPIPERLTGLSDFLRKLKIGESFECDVCYRKKIRPTAHHVGIKITIKKINENKIRVWRKS